MYARISRSLLRRIVNIAADAPDREICGLLLGHAGHICDIMPADNVADNPERRFEIDPAVLLYAMKAARQRGPAVIGHYHSHPSGVAEPSAYDAAMAAADGALWLIIGVGKVRAWLAGETGILVRFVELELAVE